MASKEVRTRIHLRSMSSVKDDVPTLAWEPKEGYPGIAIGTLVIFGGRPAAGKSTSARWFVAETSNGTLPGAWHGNPVGAAWIGTEESEIYMIKPGLRAAGADLDKVVIPELEIIRDDDSTVVSMRCLDPEKLAEDLKAAGVKVVVLDPLMSVVGASTDVNRSNEVRARLEPWVRLAEAIDGVVIGIAHLKKSFTGDVVAALNGSSAFGEVARSIFGFAKDDNADDGTRLMSHAKSSIGPETLSYTYTLEPVEVTTDSGKTATVSRFVLGEETDRTVSDALRETAAGAPPAKPEDKPMTDKAAMLVHILTGSDGGLLEVTKDDAVAHMAEAGYSADQTRRAREELAKRCRIGKPYRKENAGPYYWKLLPFVPPDGSHDGPKTTEGLPSCHPGLDQHVSVAIQGVVGKDGKVGNSLGDEAANQAEIAFGSNAPAVREATVADLESRRWIRDPDGKQTAERWFRAHITDLRNHGIQYIASFAVYEAGFAAGHSKSGIASAAYVSRMHRIAAIRNGIMWWCIDPNEPVTYRPVKRFVNDYLDRLPGDVTEIDQSAFYEALDAAGIDRDTGRKTMVRSGRINSLPAHGQAKSERIWRIVREEETA